MPSRDNGLVQGLRRLLVVFNARAKLDRGSYYNRLANEAHKRIYQNNLHPVFRAIKSLSDRGGPPEPAPVKKTDSSACLSSNYFISGLLRFIEFTEFTDFTENRRKEHTAQSRWF